MDNLPANTQTQTFNSTTVTELTYTCPSCDSKVDGRAQFSTCKCGRLTVSQMTVHLGVYDA